MSDASIELALEISSSEYIIGNLLMKRPIMLLHIGRILGGVGTLGENAGVVALSVMYRIMGDQPVVVK